MSDLSSTINLHNIFRSDGSQAFSLNGNIQFKKLTSDGRQPKRAHSGDAGYDLFVSRDVIIPPRSFVDVHTDIAVIFPDQVWGRVTGRSSTLRRRGLLVAEGIIDNGYTGELFTGVYNMGDEPVEIKKGERLAQLIPHFLVHLSWKEVKEIPTTGRGADGFGSTGE